MPSRDPDVPTTVLRTVRIGTRPSQLARLQADTVAAALQAHHGGMLAIEIVPLTTPGDAAQGTEAAAQQGKDQWIVGIEQAILERHIDIAVHSAKDVPGKIAPATRLRAVLARESPHDLLVPAARLDPGPAGLAGLAGLPEGAAVGTASPRRAAEIRRRRPDLAIRAHRGNVPTRLGRLDQSAELAAIVLAEAGMGRLGLAADRPHIRLPPADMMPAAGQGQLVVQHAADRDEAAALVAPLVDPVVEVTWRAERGLIARLDADCHSAVGAWARHDGDRLTLAWRVLAPDGSAWLDGAADGPADDPDRLADEAAADALARGARPLLDQAD